MIDKPTAQRTIGLALDGPIARLAVLRENKGKVEIRKTLSLGQSDDAPEEALASIGEALRKQERQNRDALVVSTLTTRRLLIRPLELKVTKEADVDAVLKFQAEPLIPYPLDEAIVDRFIVHKGEESCQLTVTAARKEHLQQHLDLLAEQQIIPEVVSGEPAALSAFASTFFPQEAPRFLVHIGHSRTCCVLVSNGVVLSARHLDTGVYQIEQAYERDLEKTVEQAELALNESSPQAFSIANTFRQELTQTLLALSKQARGSKAANILYLGTGATKQALLNFLTENIELTSQAADTHTANNIDTEELLCFALPIGLAASCLPSKASQLNFRQEEFAYPHPWKRLKKPIATYFALCLALAVTLFAFAHVRLQGEEARIKQEYFGLLATLENTPEDVERDYQQKALGLKSKRILGSFSIDNLSISDIEKRVDFLQKKLKSTPEGFPLLPNVPRVSDLLAWLGQHPKVLGRGESGETEALINVDSIQYSMVKRPEESRKSEKYSVRVDLEFTTQTPRQAREFHDALVEANAFVDPKEKVKWTYNRGKYRASFFLKDRTIYPTATGGRPNV